MMCGARVFIILFSLFLIVESKKFETRCKLVRELIRVGIPHDSFFAPWVCLIEKVSKRDTSAIVVTPSMKKSYGLYQIPSPKWCKEGKKGGECNIACESLLDDDIRDDTECAQLIFYREGFKFWPQWTKRCTKEDVKLITEEIYKCPDMTSPRSSPDRMAYSEILRHRRMIANLSRSRRSAKA